MAGRGAKNMALQLATGMYKGVKGIGRGIKSVVNKIENVSKQKTRRNVKMIEENFGDLDNYERLQK